MSEKISNNDKVNSRTSLFSKKVEDVKKNDVNQANAINSIVNDKIVTSQLKKEEEVLLHPILRAPIEQEESNKKIDTKSDLNFNIKTAEKQDIKEQLDSKKNVRKELLNKSNKNLNKSDLLIKQNESYINEADELNVSITQLSKKEDCSLNISLSNSNNPDTKSRPEKEDSFLYLQLLYQNLIHKNIFDRIKDTDKFDYYLDKLEQLSKSVDGLREQYQSILDDMKKYQDAYIDYWMEIYNEIKNNHLTTESEILDFLKNKNIPSSIARDLLSNKINSREEMEAFLKEHFSFMDLPDDISQYSLDDLEKLHNKLSSFMASASENMPDISMSDDKLNAISSYSKELKDLINKKENATIKNKLDSAKDIYRGLTLTQSKIELEIMSDTLSGMALLTFLLAKVRELTMKVMIQRSENEQKLFEAMQEVTEKSLQDKINDQKAQIKKQEEIQFWAGIGMKILGGLLALVAGIAAIFTAGASMALLAIAVVLFVADVALTVADEVYQAIHNKSFMDEIMQPISDAIMEVVDKIVDVIVDLFNETLDVLKKLGLSDAIDEIKAKIQDKLKMAVKILVTVALFVAAIGLSFIIGPAAKGLTNVGKKIFNQQVRQTLKKVLNDYLEAMLGKMIKQIITEACEEIMKAINKILAKASTEKASIMLNRTVVTSKLVNAAASNTVNIYSATISAKILRSVADSKKLEAILKLIQDLMDKLMESYHENIDTITEILKNMSEKSSISNRAKSNLIKNISI